MSVAYEIPCEVCQQKVPDFLPDHLMKFHQMAVTEYLGKYPGAPTISKRLLERFRKEKDVQRAHPPAPSALTVSIAGVRFPVNPDVPPEVCLPMPEHYRVPQRGSLAKDIEHAVVALRFGRSMYVWGMPGSGKDALFHAWSAMTRTPAIIQQVAPGTDIESWFFSRGFNEEGTYWEEGEVLKALRDGYVTSTGRRVPYLVLISDFDRADRAQAEHLRLVADSILGRVKGPAGKVYPVLPGTRIVATANSSGGGDSRGRMISSNPLDASILDRFERKFEFHWMSWEDEGEIVKAKFPILYDRFPKLFDIMKNVTKNLRDAILKDELHGEFSHRGLCQILGHAQDILMCSDRKTFSVKLLGDAARAWLDGLPDKENRDMAIKIMDPELGLLTRNGKTNPLD